MTKIPRSFSTITTRRMKHTLALSIVLSTGSIFNTISGSLVKIINLGGNELASLEIDEKVTPKELYRRAREAGIEWTDTRIFKLFQEEQEEPLDPLNDKELELNGNCFFNLVYFAFEALDDDQKRFVNHLHQHYGEYGVNCPHYADYFIMYFAVRKNGFAIIYASDIIKNDEEICMAAVQNNGWALQHVPDNMKTQEMCEAAVEICHWTLQFVPDNMKTQEMCEAAVRLDHRPADLQEPVLLYVPRHWRSKLICEAALHANPRSLQHIPHEIISLDICMAAVQRWGHLLRHVPDNMKTLEICKAAVKESNYALNYVPDILRNQIMQ